MCCHPNLSPESLEMTIVGLSISQRVKNCSIIGVKLMGVKKNHVPSIGLKKLIELLMIKE